MAIDKTNRNYLDFLRGISIIVVMLMHLGLSWFFLPYSQYIDVIVPLFFFISGATTWNSILNSSQRRHYFANRYITLIIPFLVFTAPFFVLVLIEPSKLTVYELLKWSVAWPDRQIYPFDMRQLWFINVLILMFLICYPFFKLTKNRPYAIYFMFVCTLFYIPFAEHFDWLNRYYDVKIINRLDLPMQIHQVFGLLNFYLFGAFFYQLKTVKKKYLVAAVLFGFAFAVFLHPQLESNANLKALFFERTTYFVVVSYIFVLSLLLCRDALLKVINDFKPLKLLLLHASKHSYALFLVHTPFIFIFENSLGLDNLGSQPVLALVKMLGVVFISLLSAPLVTTASNVVVRKLTISR